MPTKTNTDPIHTADSTAPAGSGEERSYIAFISYRHKPLDKKAAEKIQHSVEHFTVPKEFRGKTGGKRLGMVFRDEDELPASASLTGSITYALDHSEYLLVICTPDLPESAWCRQEIDYFIRTHDRDHVLAILVDGEPDESFSPLLLHEYDDAGNILSDTEPLAANIAGRNHTIDSKKYRKEIVRVYAALLGCPFDALWQRERRSRANRLMAVMGGAVALMAVFMGVVLSKNAEITRQNTQITEQNEEITAQNETITRQNNTLQTQLSETLVDSGLTQLENHDINTALKNGLAALLDGENAAYYDHRAEYLLAKALNAYQGEKIKSHLLFEQGCSIVGMAVSENGEAVFAVDETGAVRGISPRTGELLWENPAWEGNEGGWTNFDREIFYVPGADLVLIRSVGGVIARSAGDGKTVWTWKSATEGGCGFRALSPDGTRLALIDKGNVLEPDAELILLDTATGEETRRIPFGGEGLVMPPSSNITDHRSAFGGGYSSDGRYLGVSVYAGNEKDRDKRVLFFAVFDTTDGSELYRCQIEEDNAVRIFYGLHVLDDGDLLCARYTGSKGCITVTRIDSETLAETSVDKNVVLTSRDGVRANADRNCLPTLLGDHCFLVANGSDLYVFDVETLALKFNFGYTGKILNMTWQDRGEEIVQLVTGDGLIAENDLEHEGPAAVKRYYAVSVDQSGLKAALPVNGNPISDKSGTLLLVPSEQPGRLFSAGITSDKTGMALETPEGANESGVSVMSSPADSEIYAFFRSPKTLVIYDAGTIKEKKKIIYDDYIDNPCLMADGRIISASQIISSDGSVELLEKLTNKYDIRDHYIKSIRLADGKVLTAAEHVPGDMDIKACCVWIDGKLVKASQDPGTGIVMDSLSAMALGGNGYVVVNGVPEGGSDKVFVGFDAVGGRRVVIPDENAEDPDKRIAVSNVKAQFACALNSGCIFIGDLSAGTTSLLTDTYDIGEIRAVTFSEDDSYLAVMTQSGRLDIWECGTNNCVFSEMAGISTESSLSRVRTLRCRVDRAKNRLYVTAGYSDYPQLGYWTSIDTDAWVIAAEAYDAYDVIGGRLYAWRDDVLTAYPLHDLAGLTKEAEKRLTDQ